MTTFAAVLVAFYAAVYGGKIIKKGFTRSSSINKRTETLYQNQKKSFLTTPNIKNRFRSLYETLESIGDMKIMTKFYLRVCTISPNFKYIFSSSHR